MFVSRRKLKYMQDRIELLENYMSGILIGKNGPKINLPVYRSAPSQEDPPGVMGHKDVPVHEVVKALIEAMDVDVYAEPPKSESVKVVRRGSESGQ